MFRWRLDTQAAPPPLEHRQSGGLGLKPQAASLTGRKLYAMGYYRRNYVKKRSKKNNRRAVEAVEDARTSSQPASLEVYHRGEAAGRAWLSLCWLLCNEGPI